MDLGADGMLLVGGEGPSRQTLEGLVGPVRYVIAADSGFDLALRLKLVPDLLVGDLDSVSSSALLESFPGERVERYPADKEETDTEIGLRLFRQMGFRRVALVGGGAGRLDHLLGILALFERDYHPLFWLTAAEYVQPIEGEFQFEGWQGQTVSFFPLGEGAGDMSTAGLKWPLDGLRWRRGDGGISNIVTSERGWVRVGRGRLLMIRRLPELNHG